MFESATLPKIDLNDKGEVRNALALIKVNYLDKIVKEQVYYDQVNNNCSSIGHPCIRKLVWDRSERKKDRKPITPELLQIFEIGKELEVFVRRKLEKMGFIILQDTRCQKSLIDRDLQLTGRLDLRACHPLLNNIELITEIKTTNSSTFSRINTEKDLRESDSIYIRNYYTQVESYLWLVAKERQEFVQMALIVFINKETADMKLIPVYFDIDFVEKEVLTKCQTINQFVKLGKTPDCEYISACENCDYSGICDVNKQFNSGAFLEDMDLRMQLIEWDYLHKNNIKFSKVDVDVKDKLKLYYEQMKKNLLILDTFEINIKEGKRKNYEIPPEIKEQYRVEDSPSISIDIANINSGAMR